MSLPFRDNTPSLQALVPSPPRGFRDLPGEVRNKIYFFLFDRLEGRYTAIQPIAYATLASLYTVDKELWKEAVWVGDRIPSIAQHVKLSRKTLATERDMYGKLIFPPQPGLPQRWVTGEDWLKLRYVVLTIPYADYSERDDFDKPTVVQLRIPSTLARTLEQVLELHGTSCILQLARLRYDLVHVPKIARGNGRLHTIRVSRLSRAFPFTTNVWAEAAGPYESEVDMEVVRAFNISRRFVRGGRQLNIEDSLASVAAQGGTVIRDELPESEKKKLRKGIRCFEALRKEPDRGYWKADGKFVKGDRVEIQCGGCYAKFLSSKEECPNRLLGSENWKVHDTRREFLEHRHRASVNRGALALC